MPSWRWVKYGREKRGDGTGYSGHKHQKGEKELTITDNHGFIIAPITTQPVNAHDTTILPQAFRGLMTFSHRIGMDLSTSALTLDSAFDSKTNHDFIKAHGLIPVIYPNIQTGGMLRPLSSSHASSGGLEKISIKTDIKLSELSDGKIPIENSH